MRINRYSLVPLPGIPSDHQVSKIMKHAMIDGAKSLEEALELGKNAAYDAAWPMLVIDRERGAVSHKIGVIDCVALTTYSLDDNDGLKKAEHLARHINKSYWERVRDILDLANELQDK